MGYLDDIVLGHFRAKEDAIGESTAVISYAKRGADKSLPQQVARDSGPTYFHKDHAGLGVNGEDRPERSI